MRPQSSHPTDRNASTLLLTLHLGQLFSALTASEPTIYYSSLAIMIAEGGYGGWPHLLHRKKQMTREVTPPPSVYSSSAICWTEANYMVESEDCALAPR